MQLIAFDHITDIYRNIAAICFIITLIAIIY